MFTREGYYELKRFRSTICGTLVNNRENYQKLKRAPANIRFTEICQIALSFGFQYAGGEGSHRIYVRPGVNEMLNFQNVRGMAKSYQVRQFIKIIEKYGLVEE
jgi:hypothetical protein